jgi:hypothetical protein
VSSVTDYQLKVILRLVLELLKASGENIDEVIRLLKELTEE